MTPLAASIVTGVGLALVAGCTSRPLQPDAGRGGSISLDAGALGDGAARGDGSLFSGRRSFVVTSTLTLTHPGGGAMSHTFTMVVDGDSWSAILGATGAGYASPLEPAPGGFRVVHPYAFAIGRCLDVSYSDLTFRFDPTGGLVGSGSGQLTVLNDSGSSDDVTMSLTGVLDSVAPTLSFAPSGDMTDPLMPFRVLASEPLPTEVQPILRAAGGDEVVLTAEASADGFLDTYYKPEVLLRYGEAYRLDISGVRDFAGNAAVGTTTDSLTFTTRPPPPLVAQDGFESVTDATLAGAQVLSGASDPIISGTRSLYVPPAFAMGASSLTVQIALRLAVSPGDTVVRFTYRYVNSNGSPTPEFVIARVGGRLLSSVADDPSGNGSGTTATISGNQVTLGPIAAATIKLPADATDEIVFAGMTSLGTPSCFGSTPIGSLAGIIIDDLRVE